MDKNKETEEKHGFFPLVMTAAIDPKGMPGLSVNDVQERKRQYLGTFQYYLDSGCFDRIVFVENSGCDLREFRELADGYCKIAVEFISCDLNDYPRHLGKSYGEMRILDYVYEHSQSVQEAGGFIKVTGRFPILNVKALMNEAEKRRPWVFYSDCKDHKVYDWLHLGWTGHACDTRFFIVTLDFYRRHFLGRYVELDDSVGKYVEHQFFAVGKEACKSEAVVRRFRTEPEYAGKAGHVQKSIIGVNNYSGVVAKSKRRIRQLARIIVPWFWF